MGTRLNPQSKFLNYFPTARKGGSKKNTIYIYIEKKKNTKNLKL